VQGCNQLFLLALADFYLKMKYASVTANFVNFDFSKNKNTTFQDIFCKSPI